MFEVAAVALDDIDEAVESGEEFEDFAEVLGADDGTGGEVFEGDLFCAEVDEDAVQLAVVLDVFLAFFAGDAVERGLGDVDVASFDEFRHLAAEEREEERADVGAVDIGVRHDDDFVVADLADIERALAFAGADACADGGDHGLDFLVFEGLVETCFFDIDEFTAEREDGLGAAVAALFGGATGGVTFDDEELAEGGVFFRAVGEFAGEPAAGEGAFTDGFAGFASGFAGACGGDDFVDDALRERGVFLEVFG